MFCVFPQKVHLVVHCFYGAGNSWKVVRVCVETKYKNFSGAASVGAVGKPVGAYEILRRNG